MGVGWVGVSQTADQAGGILTTPPSKLDIVLVGHGLRNVFRDFWSEPLGGFDGEFEAENLKI